MANSEERLHSILATLEQCRAALVKGARPETAKLVSLAILDLRIDLGKIPDSDLKALCDAIAPEKPRPAEGSSNLNPPGGARRRAVLKLVK